MSTLKTTYIQHPSAENPSIELSADGSIVLPLSGIGDLADVDEGSGAADGDVLTYDGSSNLWLPQGIQLAAGIGSNVVQTVKTDTFTTTSTSFVDVTGFSVSITPSSATSKVLIIVDLAGQGLAGTNALQAKLVRGATDLYLGASAGSRTQASMHIESHVGNSVRSPLTFIDSPATTSSTTYKLQIRSNNANTAYVNRTILDSDNALFARVASSITAIEVAA